MIFFTKFFPFIFFNLLDFLLISDAVRKKAIMVFHRLFRDMPELMIHLDEKFRQILSERDPGVLGAILCLFVDFVKVWLICFSFKSFFSIFKIITFFRMIQINTRI